MRPLFRQPIQNKVTKTALATSRSLLIQCSHVNQKMPQYSRELFWLKSAHCYTFQMHQIYFLHLQRKQHQEPRVFRPLPSQKAQRYKQGAATDFLSVFQLLCVSCASIEVLIYAILHLNPVPNKCWALTNSPALLPGFGFQLGFSPVQQSMIWVSPSTSNLH